MYRTMLPKITMIGVIGLLVALANATEINYEDDQVSNGINVSFSESEIRKKYSTFDDVEKAQNKITCQKGYDVCCEVSSKQCGCFKFKSFETNFTLKNCVLGVFGVSKSGDLDLTCKQAKYTVKESLYSRLNNWTTLHEELEKVPTSGLLNASYCGIIGNDLQKQQQFIRFYILNKDRPINIKYETPLKLNEEISYTHLFCGTKKEVQKNIQEQSKNAPKLSETQVQDQVVTKQELRKGYRSNTFKVVQAGTPWYKKPNTWIVIGVGVFVVGGLCYLVFFNASSNEEMIQIIPDADDPSNHFPSDTDLVIEVMESITEQSIDKETTQYSFSVEHSNTSLTVTDLTTELKTQSCSELSDQSKSEVISSLQFTEETPSVESMKSDSESEYKPEKKTSQFPTKEQEKKQKNF